MRLRHISTTIGVSLVALISATDAATVDLPQTAALPAGSSSTRGFLVRTAQGPEAPTLKNNATRALNQINGTLVDAEDALVPNEAFPGPLTGGAYAVDTANFEKDGSQVDVIDADQNSLASFSTFQFPGVPGSGNHTDNFAAEVIGLVALPAGVTTFGVSSSTGRTDTENDDGFVVTVGTPPSDFFGVKVGEFQRNAPPFASNYRNETQFSVNAPVAGLYPLRLLFWQTGFAANLQWYTILDSGERILLNDTGTDARALEVYQDSSVAAVNAPYIAEVRPQPDSAGNSAAAPIEVLLVDGSATVAPADVKLALNGKPVTPQVLSKSGSKTTLSYSPNASRTEALNQVELTFRDSKGADHTNRWSFSIITTGGEVSNVTGQWDFNSGTLAATVGRDLEYLDGPSGLGKANTTFGTTTSYGIPDIGGKPASVVHLPGRINSNGPDVENRASGLLMRHGIPANGGGSRVNQYTLIADVYWEAGPGFASFLNCDGANTSDGDFFFRVGDGGFGQGGGGYEGNTKMEVGKWHRVAFAVDMAATPPVVTKFLDGQKHADQLAPNNLLDGVRRSLDPAGAALFGDGDDGELHPVYVNSVQIRSGKLSDAELAALGAATADGIPQVIPKSSVTGQWDFNNANLAATIGKDLEYLDGADGLGKANTTFGTTTSYGIPDIGGKPASVVHLPGRINSNGPDVENRASGLLMRHGIPANGGGSRVNQYTLIADVYWEAGPGFASFLNCDGANTSDGDFFFRVGDGGFGQGGGGYEGNTKMEVGKWHRVAFAVDMAATPPVVTKYLDGQKHADQLAPNNLLDGVRRSLDPAGAALFGDGDDGELHPVYVNSVQIRAGKLSDAELAALGAASAEGIPVVLPKSTVAGQWDFNNGTLAATVGKDLEYLDGADGLGKANTTFGTTTSYGIPDIGGKPASVVHLPGRINSNGPDVENRASGLLMRHGIPANGGGSRVNQYTLIADVYWEAGPGFASFLNCDGANTSDGDFFFRVGDGGFGQGGGGYEGNTKMEIEKWHRVAFAVDMAATPPVVTKFLDGQKHADQLAPNNLLDGVRRSLDPASAALFGDGDDGELHPVYVNSVQIRAGKLSDAELASLGAATAEGIPLFLTVAAPPSLSVATDSSGNVLITYTGKLQSAGTVGGTYSDVQGASSPYMITKANLAGAQYFRATE